MKLWIRLAFLGVYCAILSFSPNGMTIESSQDPLYTPYRFQRLPYAEALSNTVIKDIIQDHSGFIWIATNDGLNRFDGINNTIYRPSRSNVSAISHFNINRLFIDHADELWIGTQKGLNRYHSATDSFELIRLPQTNSKVPSLNITALFEDSNKRLWIGTKKSGVYRLSEDRMSITLIKLHDTSKVFRVNDFVEGEDQKLYVATTFGLLYLEYNTEKLKKLPQLKPTKQQGSIVPQSFFAFESGNILLGTNGGLYLLTPDTAQISPLLIPKLGAKSITAISPVDKDKVLVSTNTSGVFLVDLDKLTAIAFNNDPLDKYSLITNQVNSIFQASSGLYWIATTAGVNVIDTSQQHFGHVKTNQKIKECLAGDTIYAILNDSENTLWIGSFGVGLNQLNLNTGSCQLKLASTGSDDTSELKNIVALYENKDKDIWVGTFDRGLFKYDRSKNLIQAIDLTPHFSNAKRMKNITAITGDDDGNVWISTFYGGLIQYHSSTGRFINFIPAVADEPSLTTNINGLAVDQKGNVWLASDGRGLWKFDVEKSQFNQFISKQAEDNGIPGTLWTVYHDRDGNIWIGSAGEGAFKFDAESGAVKKYSTSEGLNGVVMNIQQDAQGDLWFMTEKGLSRLSLPDENIETFLESDGLQANAFTTAGFLDRSNNKLWTGGINGFNHFNPTLMSKRSDNRHDVVLTGFEMFYQPVEHSVNDPESPLTRVINETRNINLDYNQNVFGFTFSGLEFLNPDKINYQFMLEGYDATWNNASAGRRYANYTNIAPGEYRFKVKASDTHGKWNESEATVNITIAHPWWQTNWAYTSYIFLSILVIYLMIRLRTRQLVIRSRELEKSVVKRTEELAQEKQKVEQLLSRKNEEFANISHEFRTPLTLILGPVSQLIGLTRNDYEINNRLNVVQRNGYRLLRMVDQLLNLETFRVKAITQKAPQAFAKTIRLLTESFADLANEKNIELMVIKLADVNFEFTPDALDKIILNLLSNAIKYTKAGGKITVETQRTTSNSLKIQVVDTGIGIPADKLDSVFERYNRVLDENSEMVTGAGIGLALVKSLVEEHRGRIDIESKQGQGTCVTVYLPIIKEVLPEQVNQHANHEIVAMELMELSNQNSKLERSDNIVVSQQDSNLPLILVIEDNHDMRDYIVASIKSDYQVITACDGEEGERLAISEVPDLIISDVMMPKKDGYQTTHELRCNSVTNHIPIILLTARGDRESRLKGWHKKADEYLTKPFDTEELKIRLNNLLEIRDILRKRFGECAFEEKVQLNTDEQKSDDIARSINITEQQNCEFIDKLNEILELMYSDQKTTVADISSAVLMSDRQFFRKLKNITDLSPVEYLRRFRLEKAKQILIQGHNASYAAYEVGLSSQSYFGKCFKAQFGLSPSEFKKSVRN